MQRNLHGVPTAIQMIWLMGRQSGAVLEIFTQSIGWRILMQQRRRYGVNHWRISILWFKKKPTGHMSSNSVKWIGTVKQLVTFRDTKTTIHGTLRSQCTVTRILLMSIPEIIISSSWRLNMSCIQLLRTLYLSKKRKIHVSILTLNSRGLHMRLELGGIKLKRHCNFQLGLRIRNARELLWIDLRVSVVGLQNMEWNMRNIW